MGVKPDFYTGVFMLAALGWPILLYESWPYVAIAVAAPRNLSRGLRHRVRGIPDACPLTRSGGRRLRPCSTRFTMDAVSCVSHTRGREGNSSCQSVSGSLRLLTCQLGEQPKGFIHGC